MALSLGAANSQRRTAARHSPIPFRYPDVAGDALERRRKGAMVIGADGRLKKRTSSATPGAVNAVEER